MATAAKQRITKAEEALRARIDDLVVNVDAISRSMQAHGCEQAQRDLADAIAAFSGLRPLIEGLEAVRAEVRPRSRDRAQSPTSSTPRRPSTSPASSPRPAPPPRTPRSAARRAPSARPTPAGPRCDSCGAKATQHVDVRDNTRRPVRTVRVNVCDGPVCNSDAKIIDLVNRAQRKDS